jgi:hypothetical protein
VPQSVSGNLDLQPETATPVLLLEHCHHSCLSCCLSVMLPICDGAGLWSLLAARLDVFALQN